MFEGQVAQLTTFLERVVDLNGRYRAGELKTYVPEALRDSQRPLEELIEELLPASHAALKGASRSLFFSLPVAFDPAESVGPYLAAVDREFLSTLIEERLKNTSPLWLQDAAVLIRIDNYLHSGTPFAYLQVPLTSLDEMPGETGERPV